jgi:hypothetical protein
MKKLAVLLMALLVPASLLAPVAQAKFAPKFTVSLSDTKVAGNPSMTFHLEFAEDDDEIGLFTGYIPKGFTIATDEQIPDDEEIGSGTINIRGGIDCRPGPEGAIPLGANVEGIPATFYEKARTDEEIDDGVIAVWLLDLEPLNRVRLRVKGSPLTGYTIAGAPDPSDNTCNPLMADLTINSTSESGVKIMTNPIKAGKKKFMADITSQDSPDIAHFEQMIVITK